MVVFQLVRWLQSAVYWSRWFVIDTVNLWGYDVSSAGVPVPDIHWMKNGWLIPTHHPSSLYVSTTTDDDDDAVSMVTSVLLLEQATLRDSGMYQCQASNIAGVAIMTTSVDAYLPQVYSQLTYLINTVTWPWPRLLFEKKCWRSCWDYPLEHAHHIWSP